MSKITVWTSKGRWSEEVNGCDKVHLMKQAIREEAVKFNEAPADYKKLGDVIRADIRHKDGTMGHITDHWSGIQIDNKLVDMSVFFDYNKKNLDHNFLNKYIREQKFSDVCFFTMKLSTLQEMAEEEKTMTKLYERLIELAEVSEKGVSRLMFMFEDE